MVNPKSCPNGTVTIHRKGYHRRAYTRSDGTYVHATYVPPTTFKICNQGTKGVRSRGAKQGPYSNKKPWITHKGKLGGKGYMHKPAAERHRLLDRCVNGGDGEKAWGYISCLDSLQVLNRSHVLHAKYGNIIEADKRYLERKYGKPGAVKRSKERARRKAEKESAEHPESNK